MFKASYFKYADIYSGKYNLIMAYVSRNQDFITGAEYEPMIDTLPSRAESLLYGIKYSEKPLEFEVDIINPDEGESGAPLFVSQNIKDTGIPNNTLNKEDYLHIILFLNFLIILRSIS